MLRIKLTVGLSALFFLMACESADTGAASQAKAASTGNAPVSQSAAPEADPRMVSAVESRQAMLTVLKDNFVPLALMANGRIDYDPEVAQRYAVRLPVIIGMMEERFAVDTRGSGVETEALDKIWENMDAFKEKIRNAADAANKLAAVAADSSQFKDAAMDLRSACGSCHDDFREEQE